jgi:hypothetical protein
MGAPLEICSKRSVVAVLASGVVISLAALTGGIAPAFAKPDTDQVVTTTAPVPEPKVQAPPEEVEAPTQEAPPKVPVQLPAAPSAETPPQTQQAVQTPVPTVTQQTTAALAPASPTAAVSPPVTKIETQTPRFAPPTSESPSPTASATASATATATAQNPASPAPASQSAAVSASQSASVGSVRPSAALVSPTSAMAGVESSSSLAATPSSGSATTGSESKVSTSSTTEAGSVSVSEAAKVIQASQPQTLQAPKEDVELARNAKPIEVKPDPAPKQDVEEISNSIGLNMGVKGPFGIEASASASAKADARLSSERVWDHPVRQWRPDWVQYDEYYRPIILNPYHQRVRIVYIYDNAPRIVWIPPLARAVLEVAQFAAYSFTAVVDTAANVVNAAVDTALNVAVGSFFGGGYVPAIGMPLSPPPPPVLRYDNVPVLVRYSHATYEPFRVRRIIDVGDDARFGERKVLLDGATPAWGEWTQTASGERQFEVHRTQQFPGLDDPQEAPLPGDYQLRLASDQSSSGMSARDIFLYVAAGVTVALGFGAIGLALFLGRRRPQH